MIKIENKDCFDFFKEVDDKSVNLVLIDPPYNIKKDVWDCFTDEEYLNFMSKVFQNSERVLKDNGTLLFFHSDINQFYKLISQCEQDKFKLISQLIIYKKNFRCQSWKNLTENNSLKSWFNVNEYCFHFVKKSLMDGDKTGLNRVSNDVNNFKNLRNYSLSMLEKIGKSKKEIKKDLGQAFDHFFRCDSSQYALCTEKNYNILLSHFNLNFGDKLNENFDVKDYQELKKEYLKERASYSDIVKKFEAERYTFNTGILNAYKNVYEINNNMSNNNNNLKVHKHCTPKDLQLIKDLILTHSNKDDTVLDCFLGTGTTAYACHELGRNFVGCELNKEYYDYIKERIKINVNE